MPAALFAVLLVALAVGIWGTVLRPPAFEVRGTFVARPAANLILVRHAAVDALGMGPMELMAIRGEPSQIDAVALAPGDRVRLAVRPKGDEVFLLRMEKTE